MRRGGTFIVIDGIDGVGKATQTALLLERLEKEKIKAKRVDFPRYYDNFFGQFVGECLAGEHGDFLNLDPKIASILYAADRFESKKMIEKWLGDGYVVVADRYVSSNQIHQGGKIRDKKKRAEFLKWLERMEYGVFQIPRPDKIIYLSLPVELSIKLLERSNKLKDPKKRYLNGKRDVVEQSIKYLEDSRKNALSIIRKGNQWKEIVCNKKGDILPRETIHELVWKEVKKVIK